MPYQHYALLIAEVDMYLTRQSRNDITPWYKSGRSFLATPLRLHTRKQFITLTFTQLFFQTTGGQTGPETITNNGSHTNYTRFSESTYGPPKLEPPRSK